MCPKAICLGCGRHYRGWSLAEKSFCDDCGGGLYVDPHYDVIIGFVKSKPRKEKDGLLRKEDLREVLDHEVRDDTD